MTAPPYFEAIPTNTTAPNLHIEAVFGILKRGRKVHTKVTPNTYNSLLTSINVSRWHRGFLDENSLGKNHDPANKVERRTGKSLKINNLKKSKPLKQNDIKMRAVTLRILLRLFYAEQRSSTSMRRSIFIPF